MENTRAGGAGGGGGGGVGSVGGVTLSSIPLLDDVNELIEKEKLLLEFKVLEQQKEALEWKAKYDHLLGKVSESAINENNDNFRILEEAADANAIIENTDVSPDMSSITDYLHKRGDHYILDISGQSPSFVMAQLTKGVQVMKQYNSLLKSIYLRGCRLTDENAPLLCKMISNPATSSKQSFPFSSSDSPRLFSHIE